MEFGRLLRSTVQFHAVWGEAGKTEAYRVRGEELEEAEECEREECSSVWGELAYWEYDTESPSAILPFDMPSGATVVQP